LNYLPPDMDSIRFMVRLNLKLEPDHGLQNPRVARAIHRTESINIVHRAIRFEIQVGRRRVGDGSEIQRAVDAAELGVVENVESVNAELEVRPLLDGKTLLEREIPVVDARAGQIIHAR